MEGESLGSRTRRGVLSSAAVAGAGALAAGCGAGASGGAAVPTAQSGPASITMHARTGADGMHFQERATAFQAQNPQITVGFDLTPNAEYNTKLTTLQASNSLGDAVWANVIGPYFPMAATNATRPLDDLARRDKHDLKQYLPAVLEQIRWKGKLHGLPWLVHPGWSGLFINEAAWRTAGQAVPTWDWTYEGQFRDAGRRVTRAAGDTTEVFGVSIPFVMQAALTFLRSWGTDLLSPDGTKSLLNQPQAIAALTFAHDAMNVQRIAPRPDQSVTMMFQTGKAHALMDGYFSVGVIRQQVQSFQWGIYPMPKGPGGRGAFMGDAEITLTTSSKFPDATWKWLQFLASKETGMIVAKDRGSPGARNDVWDDPSLAADPIHQIFREWMKLVKPAPVPANARMVELSTTVNVGLRELYLATKSPPQAIADLHQSVQRLLDS